MIKQYKITLTSEEINAIIPKLSSYNFYGLLTELAEPKFVELLHNNGFNPISQYILRQKEKDSIMWVVNLLGKLACEQFSSMLEGSNSFFLKSCNSNLNVKDINITIIPSDDVILHRASEITDISRPKMEFLTASSFKVDNQYKMFPSVELIIKNLVRRWNNFSDLYLIEDEDVVNALIHSVKILGYNLQSNYFSMKGTKIPAFSGEVRFGTKLSIPIAELFKLLFLFSEYSGVGIKTALGMGAVKMRF